MQAIPSSYRDHSGYVFIHEQKYFRAVREVYKNNYACLMQSGLYESLTLKQLLITHQEVDTIPLEKDTIKILYPEQIPVISYAYEWSFSMLQDAALCTLNNAIEAISFGMILKDANTYNIQFRNGAPILIDTLSFEKYHETESWIAYRQFCEHFLAPLVIMKYCNTSLNKLLLAFPNGIPLQVCKSMLPFKAAFNIHVYLHIYLHSKLSAGAISSNRSKKQVFTKQKLINLLQGLKGFVSSLKMKNDKTIWDDYYQETIMSRDYLLAKRELVQNFLNQVSFKTLLDIGANDGEFSMLYKNNNPEDKNNKLIIALDEDRNCIEKLYTVCKKEGITNIIALIGDLTSPSPDIGWNNEERPALLKRIHADITMALALIHHLAIAHNIPLEKIISLFHSFSPFLIIEFVEKEDPKVKQLLLNRKDVFDDYTLTHFKTCIIQKYEIITENRIADTHRVLFLLKRKG